MLDSFRSYQSYHIFYLYLLSLSLSLSPSISINQYIHIALGIFQVMRPAGTIFPPIIAFGKGRQD